MPVIAEIPASSCRNVQTPLLSWRFYIATVVAIGAYVVAASAVDLVLHPPATEWLYPGRSDVSTGSFSVKLPSISARISVSEALVFVAVLFFGPSGATVIVAFDTLIMTGWSRGGNRPRLRAIFNVSAGSTAIWIAAYVFRFLLPETPTAPQLEQLLIPVSF